MLQDGSDEEDSPESEQTDSLESRGTKNTATGASGGKKGGADWEIMDGLKVSAHAVSDTRMFSRPMVNFC